MALSGCSALRVAYNTGPQIVWWWLDGYVDFSREQAPQVKAALESWFDWHRATQLPEYATLLVAAQAQVMAPLTPAAACLWNTRAADVLPGLGEAQLRHIEQRYAKGLDEMREEYLQADPAERQLASVKRTIERAEQLYGRLDDAQRKVITEGVAASPFDPQGWMEERKRRQRDTLSTLRRLIAERADRDKRLAALRALAERGQRSPDPTYRAYQQRLIDFNCAFVSRVHNATTLAQRQKARANLKGWEEDVRALVSGGAPAAGDPAATGSSN